AVLGAGRSTHADYVFGLLLEAAAGGLARGSAVPAPVEGDDRDAGRRQDAVPMLVEVPVADAALGAVYCDERRRAIAVGPRDGGRQDCAVGRDRKIRAHSLVVASAGASTAA